ncbi:MAG: sodium:proton antiporter NhaD [Proteobacteria bacterium]|nr:sodium:proton antiporter NhaD [Pseudomonadota bacterium]
MRSIVIFILALLPAVLPAVSLASTGNGPSVNLNMTTHIAGFLALGIFVLAYGVVMMEEFIHLRKSKPVILAAGLIWLIVAIMFQRSDLEPHLLKEILQHNLIEYASLLLFLLVAMTYINAMTERNVFEALRSWLVRREFGYRKLFWITGLIAFFLSPIADNLTTALLMGAVVLSVGSSSPRFVALGCINIVVAANAGGAFSPFGDITTLMVWQSGHAAFFDFFSLFLPSLVNFMIPATIMSMFVPNEHPHTIADNVKLRRGALVICGLFLVTIATAVCFEQFLHLPPYLGMMTGLSYLLFFGYYLRMTSHEDHADFGQFNIFNKVSQAEWDTLFFFFGVIFCVGGLGFIGYLDIMSHFLYTGWGPTNANIAMGLLSAIVDNIPVMFAILTMNPDMSTYQWLLITLTTGVGGSLLSIGSAAGVALMGQARGIYTFFGHLKWTWTIVLGYVGSIYCHHLINSSGLLTSR